MMKKLFFMTPVILGVVVFATTALAAHTCYNPTTSGFSEMVDSGGKFTIWGVPGANSQNGIWIMADKPESRLVIAYIQGRLDRAKDKGGVVHIRFGDDGYFWSISDVMTTDMCQQMSQ